MVKHLNLRSINLWASWKSRGTQPQPQQQKQPRPLCKAELQGSPENPFCKDRIFTQKMEQQTQESSMGTNAITKQTNNKPLILISIAEWINTYKGPVITMVITTNKQAKGLKSYPADSSIEWIKEKSWKKQERNRCGSWGVEINRVEIGNWYEVVGQEGR